MGIGLAASLLAGEPARADAVLDRLALEKPLWSPRGFFDAVAGPFIAFFKAHGVGGGDHAAGDQPFTGCPISCAGR